MEPKEMDKQVELSVTDMASDNIRILSAAMVEQAKSGLVCSSPFNQIELNSKLSQMLHMLGKEKWTENGLEYGRKADLYSMPERAVDLLEKFSAGA